MSHALSDVHTPIVVIRESGLTIIEFELELELVKIIPAVNPIKRGCKLRTLHSR